MPCHTSDADGTPRADKMRKCGKVLPFRFAGKQVRRSLWCVAVAVPVTKGDKCGVEMALHGRTQCSKRHNTDWIPIKVSSLHRWLETRQNRDTTAIHGWMRKTSYFRRCTRSVFVCLLTSDNGSNGTHFLTTCRVRYNSGTQFRITYFLFQINSIFISNSVLMTH